MGNRLPDRVLVPHGRATSSPFKGLGHTHLLGALPTPRCVDLLERNLVIVAGKGGVGKTTTSAAVALHLAEAGRKTLLVTVDPARRLADALGVPLSADPSPVQPRLFAMMLDPRAIITQHLAERVPQAKVQEHPLFRYVTNNLPGLNELMAIGKLNDLRKAGDYDVIVVDTAPTGHALSFLSAPKAIEELLGERSLVIWAVRIYDAFQKITNTVRRAGSLFRKDDKPPVPDVDFERIFDEMKEEAGRIRAFLADPERSAVILVTLPEKLPVSETCELEEKLRTDLGMHVHGIVVNKMQPDPMAGHAQLAKALSKPASRDTWVASAASATGLPQESVDALVQAAEFGQIRRRMNEAHLEGLEQRLPDIPRVFVPLFREDVSGLKALKAFEKEMFDS